MLYVLMLVAASNSDASVLPFARYASAPDVTILPAYPVVVGTVTVDTSQEYPCSVESFRTSDSVIAVYGNYKDMLEKDGWSPKENPSSNSVAGVRSVTFGKDLQ